MGTTPKENLRPVKFKFWDKVKRAFTEEQIGYFHSWGCEYEEFENGPGNYTVAIVEDEQGVVHTILPTNLTFIIDSI